MSARSVLLLAVLAVAGVVLVTRREAASPAPAPARAEPAARPKAKAHDRAVDPASIRDVFRFASRPSAEVQPLERGPAPALVIPKAPSPDPVRLVGLVRRQGQLLAAFAVDGDVVLAGAGAAVGGFTVLEVGEEGVRIRRRDGTEERLALP